MIQVQAGDLVFSGKRKPGWYSTIVMWATRSKFSHCFPIVGTALGELCALEADLDVTMVSWQAEYVDKQIDYYEVWRPVKAPDDAIAFAGKYCFDHFAEEVYGFSAIPWFLARSILARVGVRLKRNWFTGMVCSSLLYEYWKALGTPYTQMLTPFASNTVDPQELRDLVSANRDCFVFVGERT